MSGEWVKMRGSLTTHPKVLMIAEIIGQSREVGRRLANGFDGALREIVTRDVTRDIAVTALLRVWCAANEHTTDGLMTESTLETIDQIAGIPGFGAAMEAAGWAKFAPDDRTVLFPNFLKFNVPSKNGARSAGAERQRRYRESLRGKSDPISDVTRDVTRDITRDITRDVEKRREEKRERDAQKRASRLPPDVPNGNDVAFAKTERPDLDIAATTARFRDYWTSQPGQKGVKADWSATWRNWVRREDPGPNRAAGPSRLAI